MPTYRAYCTGCDAEIDVRIGPDGPERLQLRDIACPHEELCGEEHCLLARPGGKPLAQMLEFLPGSDEGSDGESGHAIERASRQVEEARKASLSREMRRFRKWWASDR